MEAPKTYTPKWEIGQERFTALDGSTFFMWYVAGLTKDKEDRGGFRTEEEAITYLYNKLVKK